jgi:hypothetical protein
MKMKCWVVLYVHRFGSDAWVVFAERKPTKKQIIKTLMDWEGDERDDEYVEIRGPFVIPKGRKTR